MNQKQCLQPEVISHKYGPWPAFLLSRNRRVLSFWTWKNTSCFSGSFRPIFRGAVSLGTTSSWLFDAWCVDRFGARGKPRNWTAFSDRKIVYYWNFGWPKRSHLQILGHKKELSESQLPGKLIKISYFSYRLLASAWFSKLCYLNEVLKNCMW